ncbi:radical SAM/SPASM domain-containing protein [Azospirillum halopraeferens]|uniref:radical SAM/SPASM domain-containing protein n=1 Tax=Azospirillum halopraeferens TaxID=34010 RepID=UPI0003FD4F80|nr:radical SAM protein [Azospirillum halopraeferens]
MSSITRRVDAITAIPQAYLTAAPPPPRSVKIELTARCDLQCFFCATGYKLRDRADIDRDLLVRLLHEMRAAGVEEIGLFYLGESMLYPRLAEAVAVAKRDCGYPYVFLTTNGRMASPEKVRACMEAGLDSLKFSINAADARQYKEITRVDAFDRVIANLKEARAVRDAVLAQTGHRCGLYASSILYDGEQKERMQRTVDAILPYVDEHYYLPLYNQAGFTAGAGGTTPVAGNIGRVGALRDPLPCWAVFTEGHVTYDGKLSACCFDHDGRFDMGDLTTTPFRDAWNGARFRDLRAAHLERDVTGTVCERCIAYRTGDA